MSASSDIRKLLRKLEAQGATIERGGSHWKIKLASGQLVAVVPTHPTREFGSVNRELRATLRRAGFDV